MGKIAFLDSGIVSKFGNINVPISSSAVLLETTPDDPSVSGQLVSWLSTNTDKTLDGSGVQTWHTEVGSSNNDMDRLNAATQPSIVSGVQNGLDAVYFDGSEYLQGVAAFYNLFSGDDKPCTVLAVIRSDELDSATLQEVFALGRLTDATPLMAFGVGTDTQNDCILQRRADDGGSALGRRGGVISSGTWQIVGFSFTGTECDVYIDGSTVFNNPSGMDVNTMNIDSIVMGAFKRTSVTDFFKGMIGEMVIYTSGLDGTAMSGISNWLQSKWSI
jgi:hypothetical protein